MGSSTLSLIFLFFASLITLCPDVVSSQWTDPRWECDFKANFTTNSTYATNLDNLFSRVSSPSNLSDGFYYLSAGQSPDQVYATALCRADQNLSNCRSCLNETVWNLKQYCPNTKVAYGWVEVCSIYYSNQDTYTFNLYAPFEYVPSSKSVSDIGWNVSQFNQDRAVLLNNLIPRAAAGGSLKYAADKLTSSSSELLTIHALVQCTPNLNRDDCNECLSVAMVRLREVCNGAKGCKMLQPSCNLRYDIYKFYTSIGEEGIIVPSPPEGQEGNVGNKTRKVIIIVISTIISTMSLLLSVWICFILKKPMKDVETSADEMSKVESLQYNFATIQGATNNFCDENKLGQGGFGVVYKGKLANGQEVAVKRLSSGSGQGDLEFKNEILLVAKLQHRNLVRLLGFCLEGDERLLIYEYVPNTSLDRFIFDPVKGSQLGWEKRLKIIGGIARGLLYLHEDSLLRIIHRDLKASNILLDEELNSKIADFGIARLFFKDDETHGNTNRIMGTYGYMAPEYAMHGRFSVKSDVFSFGVLILEIVSGKKNECSWREDNDGDPLHYAWKHWREGKGLALVDPTLKSNGSSSIEMMKCIHIGLLCVQENVADRPTMAYIVHMLSGNSTSLPMPSEPIYIRQRRNTIEAKSNRLKNESLPVTINDVTITELFPR